MAFLDLLAKFPCGHWQECAVPVDEHNEHLPSYKLTDDGPWVVCGECRKRETSLGLKEGDIVTAGSNVFRVCEVHVNENGIKGYGLEKLEAN